MTTLRHERTYGDLENPMTTAINPGCTCGAHNFGPGAAHVEGCYILLLKEAEAVEGVPVRDLAREQQTITANDVATVSAAHLAGQQPVNPPAPADDLYAPAERQRTTYTNNGLATSGDFPPKLTFTIAPPQLITSIRLHGSNNTLNAPLTPSEYDTEGKPTKYATPAARFRLDGRGEAQGHDGPFPVFHVTLINQDGGLNGLAMDISTGGANLVGPLAAMPIGGTFDVVRTPNVSGGRANWYEIYQVD